MRSSGSRLNYAKSDAQRLAEALKASVGRYYGSESLQLLLDEEATPAAITSALESIVATADPHDTIVFSFAGHGVKGDDDHYYLTPAGYDSNDAKGTGLSWSRISAILGRAKARRGSDPGLLPFGPVGRRGPGHQRRRRCLPADGRPRADAGARGVQGPTVQLRGIPNGAAAPSRTRSSRPCSATGAALDLDGNGVIEVSELYRALRSMVAGETQGNQNSMARQAGPDGDFSLF